MDCSAVNKFAAMPAPGHVTPTREEQAKKAQLSRTQFADDLTWLMSDKRGRRIMFGLLGDCGIYRQSYIPSDTHGTAFREGVRSVGLMLVDHLREHCPDRMSEMHKEVKANATGNTSS